MVLKEVQTVLGRAEYVIEENYTSPNIRARPKDIKYVINENNCWICISHAKSRHRGNYPVIRRFDKYMRLSRYIYWLFNGYLDESKYVMHICDNPECINPEHLKLGTPKENTQDMISKNRHAYGEQRSDSKLTTKDVLAIYICQDSCIEVARRYGVSKKLILNIRHRKSWKKILDEFFPNDNRWSREVRYNKEENNDAN